MARFTFSINGMIDLEPISFDKVDKFYTSQNEFLRDSSVMTSTSRYSEMLSLATFAFDVSKQEDLGKLETLIAICRSFPYVFIKSDAIVDQHLVPMNLSIGSGYFMYAIHEYEAEMNSDNPTQGIVTFSMRLQMVNWRPLARSVKFISIYGADKQKTTREKFSDISNLDPKDTSEGGGYVEYVSDPNESTILQDMVGFYKAKAAVNYIGILNQGMKRPMQFNLGYPVILSNEQDLASVKENLVWGMTKTYRVLKTVSTSGTGSDSDQPSTTNRNVSQISGDEESRWDEESRIKVGWIREEICGSKKTEEFVSLQSIVVRRRNRFANQTIQGFSYPYPQYLGHAPTELLTSTVVNHTKGMTSSPVLHAVQRTSHMTARIRVTVPALKGIDVIAVENPLANAMGLEFVVVDSTHSSTHSSANNLLIHNHTFIESNSLDAVENSKYALASSSNEWNDSLNQSTRILELVNKHVENEKTGTRDKGLSSINDKIQEVILQAVEDMVEEDKSDIPGQIVKPGTFLAPLVNYGPYRAASKPEKVQQIVGFYFRASEAKSGSASEERVKQEGLRKLESAISKAYRRGITSALDSPIALKALAEDNAKQERWMDEHAGSSVFLKGEGIPDLRYSELLARVPESREYPTWKDLPALPFIYDTNIVSGEKVLSMWDELLPKIDEMLGDMGAVIKPLTEEFTNIESLKNISPTEGGTSAKQNPDGSVTLYKNGQVGKTDYKPDVSTRDEVNAKLSSMPGKWLPLTGVTSYKRLSSPFGMRIHPVTGGRKMHSGVDLAGPTGTPIYAPADGVVSKAGVAGGYGNFILLDHGSSYGTAYGHLHTISVRVGMSVRKGQLIGTMGSTGRSTGPHLHYEVRIGGKKVDPVSFHQRAAVGKTGVITQSPTKSSDVRTVKESTQAAMAEARAASGIASGVPSLKDFIAAGESGGGYNTVNWAKAGGWGASHSYGLTNLTVNEVMARQRNKSTLNAVGKYQIIGVTMVDVKRGLGLSGNEKMTPELQERMGTWLIFHKRRDLRDYITGKSNNINAAAIAFASEWSSVPDIRTGKSRYAGDKAWHGHSPQKVLAALRATRARYLAAIKEGKSPQQAEIEASGSRASVAIEGGDTPAEAALGYLDKVAAPRSSDAIQMEIDPTPWAEEVQAKSRIENLVRDFRYGMEKLIPTFKVYIVHGNNENSLLHLINYRLNASYYELSAVRNIKVEMANQENPVAVASFEVMNPLNTASDPKELGPGGKNVLTDLSALESEEAQIIAMDMLRVKAGNKIQIRMGYGNDPDKLDIVFNGLITETSSGEIIRVVAEGHGRELQNQILFMGDVLGTFTFLSDVDNKYISAAVAKVLKSAPLQHFGRNPKWLADVEDDSDTDGMNVTTEAAKEVGNSGLKAYSELWNTNTDEYFFYNAKGPTDALENFWLMNVDIADRFYTTNLSDFLPFRLNDMFPDFAVHQKTTWDVIVTGRRLFPSSISLIKNMDGRCTVFTGIKEQMMIGRQRPRSLASEFLSTVRKDNESKSGGVLSAITGPGIWFGNKIAESTSGSILERRRESMLESEEGNAERLIGIVESSERSKTTSLDSYIPATNFHLLSDSHNIISNQMKLNQNCITSVELEYGDDPEDFGFGKLSKFDMSANGGLMPAYINKEFLSDSSLSSLGMAVKTGQGYLLERLEEMYDGNIIISGNPMVQPGDYAYIKDDLRQMKGTIKIREVQHVFTEYDGYITIVTPGMHVEPATYMYSNLYLKMGIFMSFLAGAFTEYREITSVRDILGATSVSTQGSTLDSIYGAGNLNKNNIGTGIFVWDAVVTAGSAVGTFFGVRTIGRGLLGLSTRLSTGWTSGILGKAAQFTSSIGSKFVSTISRIRPLIQAGSYIARGVGFFAGGSLAVAAAWGVVILIAAVALWKFLAGVYEAYKLKVEMRHRALLKLPVRVYDQEYTAGLFGWNNELTPFEMQIENIKKTARSISDIYGASRDTTLGTKGRLLLKVLSED